MDSDFTSKDTTLWSSGICIVLLASIKFSVDCSLCLDSSVSGFSTLVKSVSMRKPGRTRQGVIMLKSPISLQLGTNVRYQELAYVTECQVKILNSLGDPGSPCKNRHFARLCIIN